jgi:arylsulfatase A-like enzyme
MKSGNKRLLVLLAALAASNCGPRPADKPNVIVIMVDDLGYRGTSSYDANGFETPAIDRLAAEGIAFTDFHSNSSVCSPTRAALMTGLYPSRLGIKDSITVKRREKGRRRGIQDHHLTFAEAMKSGGYATGLYGKWHLGFYPEHNPLNHGFDHFIGFMSGQIDYHSHVDRVGKRDWFHGKELADEEGYATDLSTGDALDFIERYKDEPFFLYLAYGAPHSPMQGRGSKITRGPGAGTVPEYAKQYPNLDGEGGYVLAGDMIKAVDDGVGLIREKLEALGLGENTVIWFISDNGGSPRNKTSPERLRGRKDSPYEGGHRVPGIVWAPGRINPGQVSAEIVLTMDLMPTSLAMAGIPPPEGQFFDGIDLSPLLFEQMPLPHRYLFWGEGAIRDGDWKLVASKGKNELYNLKEDLGERNDLSNQYPERVQKLRALYGDWKKSIRRQKERERADASSRRTGRAWRKGIDSRSGLDLSSFSSRVSPPPYSSCVAALSAPARVDRGVGCTSARSRGGG